MTEEKQRSAQRMLDAAQEKLAAAEELARSGYYRDALSRAYYAAFHAVSMLLYLDGKTFSRHGQVLGTFNKDYVSTGLLPGSLSQILGALFDERQSADYDVYTSPDQDEAKKGVEDARMVVFSLKTFSNNRFQIDLH